MKTKSTKDKESSWIVTAVCSVTKEIVCANCTEAQAVSDPFVHAIQEREIAQSDYEVVGVEENT